MAPLSSWIQGETIWWISINGVILPLIGKSVNRSFSVDIRRSLGVWWSYSLKENGTMHGELHVIHSDGSVIHEEIHGSCPLEKLQRAVGGYIETVERWTEYEGHRAVVFCNEDGKLDGLPVNELATRLWHEAYPDAGDTLVGDVVVATGDNEFMDAV